MFGEVRAQIDTTREELSGLDTIIERLGTLAAEAPALAAVVTGAVAQMDGAVAGLTYAGRETGPAPRPGVLPPAVPVRTGMSRLAGAPR
jgi:hypothetical protein